MLDTKYKVYDQPLADDVEQVVAYAASKYCREAILVYPQALANPLDEMVGRIRVRSLTFGLDGDLEEAGRGFDDLAGGLRVVIRGGPGDRILIGDVVTKAGVSQIKTKNWALFTPRSTDLPHMIVPLLTSYSS